DMRPDFGEVRAHPVMQRVNRLDSVEAAGYAGLIGHHECQVAEIVAELDGLPRAGDPFEVLDLMYIRLVDIEDPVPVEENRRAPHPFGKFALRAFKVGGHTDVDEEAVIQRRPQLPLL